MNTQRNSKHEAAGKLAESIREKLSLSFPFNIEDVVQRLGGQCIPEDDYLFDAQYSVDGADGFSIHYEKRITFGHKQFAVARELGALLLCSLAEDGRFVKSKLNAPAGCFLRGIEDEFAACLLMPKDEFVNFCGESLTQEGNIDFEAITKHFGVSQQVADIRGQVLCLWPDC